MCLKDEVLLVDDDPSEQAFVGAAFDALGFECELTYRANGRSALSRLDKKSPQMILLDLRMPGMSGFDVLDELKKREDLHQLPVIVLSNSTVERDRDEALRKGAMAYFVKPMTPNGYTNMIGEIERIVCDDDT